MDADAPRILVSAESAASELDASLRRASLERAALAAAAEELAEGGAPAGRQGGAPAALGVSAPLRFLRQQLLPDGSPECAALQQRLQGARGDAAKLARRRAQIRRRRQRIAEAREALQAARAVLLAERDVQLDLLDSYRTREAKCRRRLLLLCDISCLNDTHFIWFSGSFGHINYIPLRATAATPPRWESVNAVMGSMASLLYFVAQRLRLRFRHFDIEPRGSFTTLRQRMGSPAKRLELFTDGAFMTTWMPFQSQSFNNAVVAFLACIREAVDAVIERRSAFRFPYEFTKDGIGGARVTLSIETRNSMEYMRGIKNMMTALKWLCAATCTMENVLPAAATPTTANGDAADEGRQKNNAFL